MEAVEKAPTVGPSTSKKAANGSQIRTRNKISDTDRQRIINAYLKGFDAKPISKMFDVKLFTVYGILNQYKRTGKMVSCRRGGNNPKLLSNEAASSIRSWLEEDNTLTLKKLAQKVWEQYHVRVSASTVAREIRGFHKALQRRRWDSQTSEPISVQLNAKKKSLSAKENGVDESTGQITIKHEYDTFSDDDVQFNDQIDIGETTITESCEVEQVFIHSISAHNENELTNRSECAAKRSSTITKITESCNTESDVESRPAQRNYNKQRDANPVGSELVGNGTDHYREIFTIQTLEESHTADTLASKTEYTYLPNSSSVETSNNSAIKTVAANGNSIFNEVSNNSTAAKTICTHCSCIDKLLSEQKTMIKQFFTNQQTIMNKIQETQQTLMSKLEFIEGSLKNERNKE